MKNCFLFLFHNLKIMKQILMENYFTIDYIEKQIKIRYNKFNYANNK